MSAKKCSRDNEFPDCFILEPVGLYINADGSKIRVTRNWLRVLSKARTHDGEGWSLTVAYENSDGQMAEVVIPMVDLMGRGGAGLKRLVNAGVEITPGCEKHLVLFLRSSVPQKRDLLVQAAGWVPGRHLYVTPHTVIGDVGGERVIYRPEQNSPTEASMRSSGTLQGWIDNIASLAKGNPLLVFALLAGLAGSLLRHLRLDGGGFNLFGPSSRGKTTWLMVGASCAGCGADPATNGDSYVRRWNVTGNAVEALGAAHNDNLLALDELGTAVIKDLDALVYNLTGGQGKSAMNSTRQLQRQRSWSCIILSTGELSFRAKIAASGGKVMAGQLIRMIDIEAGSTIFHDTHGLAPADFANRLKAACSAHYGTAAPAFIAKLIDYLSDDAEGFRQSLLEALEQFVVELTPEGLPPEQARAVRRFAFLRVAGELAVQFGILPLTDDDVRQSVEFARDRWLSGSRGEVADADRAIRALQGYILRNHSAFASTRAIGAKVLNAKGFFNSENSWYLFDDAQLQTAVSGFDVKETVRSLRENRLLVTHEGGRLKVKQKIASMGDRWIRFYAVKGAILETNLDAPDEGASLPEESDLIETDDSNEFEALEL